MFLELGMLVVFGVTGFWGLLTSNRVIDILEKPFSTIDLTYNFRHKHGNESSSDIYHFDAILAC